MTPAHREREREKGGMKEKERGSLQLWCVSSCVFFSFSFLRLFSAAERCQRAVVQCIGGGAVHTIASGT